MVSVQVFAKLHGFLQIYIFFVQFYKILCALTWLRANLHGFWCKYTLCICTLASCTEASR